MRNFDEQIDRSNTEATKWERYRKEVKGEPYIPLWLADMDLPCSEAIQDALCKRANHPIYGYTDRSKRYLQLFADYENQTHMYDIEDDDVILSTGVMYSITCAIRMFSDIHDEVVVLSPCYHPFITSIENSGRKVIRSQMKINHEGYGIDFENMEMALSSARLLLLCNPHNPTGRVFSKVEMTTLAYLCEKHHITIVCDEIHADITYTTSTFHPFMNVSEYAKQHTISCVSPTKAFNIAGLKISAVIIKNKEWKDAFQKEAATIGISSINLFAMEAIKAAYLKSREWQSAVLQYLEENRRYFHKKLESSKTKIQYFVPDATYFYWLDFSKYQNANTFYEVLKQEGHVICSQGTEFDKDSQTFLRLNFACPRTVLEKALDIMVRLLERM